jgi:hypothetical protein
MSLSVVLTPAAGKGGLDSQAADPACLADVRHFGWRLDQSKIGHPGRRHPLGPPVLGASGGAILDLVLLASGAPAGRPASDGLRLWGPDRGRGRRAGSQVVSMGPPQDPRHAESRRGRSVPGQRQAGPEAPGLLLPVRYQAERRQKARARKRRSWILPRGETA